MVKSNAKPLLGETGESGTTISSGVISGEEYNPKLTGSMALQQYEQMRRSDATVRAAMRAIKQPILSANYEIDAASDEQKDIDVATLVRHCMFEEVDWKKTLGEILTSLDFGFSVFEKVLEPKDIDGVRRIALVKLAYRKQTTIQKWETDGGGEGITQSVAGATYSIPIEKLVRFTQEQEGDNYEGISLLRTSYKNWFFKEKLYKIDAVGHEKHNVGTMDITYPKGTSDKVKKEARKAARNMRANEQSYVDHEEGITFSYLAMPSNRSDIKPSIDHHDRQIMKNVLAQFLELGGSGSGSGSRAVSEDHSRLFTMAVQSVADQIVNVLQDYVIKPLVDLNFTDVKVYPKLRVDKISDDNIPVLSEAISKFVTAGVFHPRPQDENSLRRIIGMAEVDQEELDALYEAKEPIEPDTAEVKLKAARALHASLESDLYGRQTRAA